MKQIFSLQLFKYFLVIFLTLSVASCKSYDGDDEPHPFIYGFCDEIRGVETNIVERNAYGELSSDSHDIVLYDNDKIYDISIVWVDNNYYEPTSHIKNPSDDGSIFGDEGLKMPLGVFECEWGSISYKAQSQDGPYETKIHITENVSDKPRLFQFYPFSLCSFYLIVTQSASPQEQ